MGFAQLEGFLKSFWITMRLCVPKGLSSIMLSYKDNSCYRDSWTFLGICRQSGESRSDMTNLLYPIPWMKYLNASVSFAGCKHTEMLIYNVARLNIFQKFNLCIFLSTWMTCIRFFLQNVLKLGILMSFPSLLEHLHFSCYHIWISSLYIQCVYNPFWTPPILCFSIIWSVLDVYSTFAFHEMLLLNSGSQ